MAFEFRLPDIGEGVVEGEIVKWLVKPGDEIAEDQPLVEVMTDKATVVIPSPKSGKVLETRGKEGDIAQVHDVLAVIQESGKAAAAAPAPAAAEAPRAEAPSPAPAAPALRPTRPYAANETVIPEPVEPEPTAPPRRGDGDQRKVLAAPATRRLARELGIELSSVEPTGSGGRITSDDVRRAAERGPAAAAATQLAAQHAVPASDRVTLVPVPVPPPPALAPAEHGERVPVRGLRKRIWENMARSATLTARFTFVEECDCTALVELRERFNERLGAGEHRLTFLPFIIKAVIAALKHHPQLNGHVDEQAMEFVLRHDYHLGIAVATDRGLIVPVIRNADRRSLLDLSAELKRLGDAARDNKIGIDDLGGSTFTITSLGKDGGIFATPVINHPEVAIMGVHKMVKRPVVIDDEIAIRSMMNLSLSFDHRLIDGHIGAAFTYTVIRLLENPERLMMEMA